MAGVTLLNTLNRSDPAPAWRWRIAITAMDISGLLQDLLVTTKGLNPGANRKRELNLYAEEITSPFMQLQPGSTHVQGAQRTYPHDAMIDPITIMFYEDTEYTITRFLTDWMQLIYQSSDFSLFSRGNYGVPVDYMANIRLYPQDYQGRDATLFRYQNVFPSHIQDYQYSHDSMRIIVACTFYSWWNVVGDRLERSTDATPGGP